jgi:hypothetical protein
MKIAIIDVFVIQNVLLLNMLDMNVASILGHMFHAAIILLSLFCVFLLSNMAQGGVVYG